MSLKYYYFDDDDTKLEVLEGRISRLLWFISLANDETLDSSASIPGLMHALAQATYDLVIAQIEAYYWQHPHLACRLRTWVTAILQEGSRQLIDDSMIFNAIRNGLPAEQLESLMDKLNE